MATARLIRELIAMGATDQMIDAVLRNPQTVTAVPAAIVSARVGRRSHVQPATVDAPVPPAVIASAVPPASSGRPNGTRVGYRVTAFGQTLSATLVGNNAAVYNYIASAWPRPVDSRELRANVLQHKLRADGTNKAIESAVHSLKTDYAEAMIVAIDKADAPAQPSAAPAVRNAVTLD